MDAEITAAAAGGLKFWAFVWYAPGSSLRTAWNLYQSSTKRNVINWCGIVTTAALGSSPFASQKWRANVQQWADYMCAPSYQKVSADGAVDRPLLFILWHEKEVENSFGGDLANVGKALYFLRERVTAAGLGAPYIVVLHGVEGASVTSAIGAQAISNYISGFGPAHSSPYRDLDKQTRAYWATLESTGRPVVPIAMVGWDTRAREENPGPFHINGSPEQYYALASPAELADHLRAAVRYIQDHPRACPSKVLLIYSWDECDEGGGLIPTLGDPTGLYLSAIAPEIR